jgi:MoaA/NifB/PqqE/SkfB family radical SAM enzyme
MSESKALEKRKWVRLTRACNNRCLFCLDEEALDGSCLPLRGVRAELLAGRRQGCTRAVLSGGEPTLHPDFVRIVRMAKRAGYSHVQVITNGRLFCYGDLLRDAVSAGLREVTFSVHGHRPALHDALVGVRGAFVQTVRGIANALKVPGLVVSSDVVINRLNIDGLETTLKMLYRLGVREYDLLQVMPFGRAWMNWRSLYYSPKAKKKQLVRALDCACLEGVHLWTNRFRPELLEGREGLIQHPAKLLDEVRGRGDMLKDYLKKGVPRPCEGARCSYCPLEAFCRDLALLRAGKELTALRKPPCLGAGAGRRAVLAPSSGVEAAAKFFIRRRYFVKGRRCARCARRGDCGGAPVADVMRRGFGALSPFKK